MAKAHVAEPGKEYFCLPPTFFKCNVTLADIFQCEGFSAA